MAKNTTNTITVPTTKAVTENRDFLKEIRNIVKGMNQDSAFYAVADFLSKEEGAIEWLLIIKEKCEDHLVVFKNFEFNPSDMIGIIITMRIKALEKAVDINMEDVLQELESIAWCCRLS